MALFCVQCFDENGVPKDDGKNYKVEAPNMLEAAEKICGGPLTQSPRPAMYRRADVRIFTDLNAHNYFYEPS